MREDEKLKEDVQFIELQIRLLEVLESIEENFRELIAEIERYTNVG